MQRATRGNERAVRSIRRRLGTTPQSVTANLTGLTPGTTYHFRAVAANSAGTTDGADTTFQTLVAFMVQVGAFGAPGTIASQFQTPVGVAAFGGKVYVADSANARVQRFNEKGVFKAAWGWGVKDGQAKSEVCTNKKGCQAGIPGSGPGQFQNPTSVAVDNSKGKSKGSVYVGDAGNNVVTKFNSSGKPVLTINGTTATQGHFRAWVAWPSTGPATCGPPMSPPATSTGSTATAPSSRSSPSRPASAAWREGSPSIRTTAAPST